MGCPPNRRNDHPAEDPIVEDNVAAAKMLSLLLTKMDRTRWRWRMMALRRSKSSRSSLTNSCYATSTFPGVDGYHVARAIRAYPAFRGVLLVALPGTARKKIAGNRKMPALMNTS